MRFALALAFALGLAVMSGAAQRSTILINGRNLQTPINHGLPDKPLGFTFCRLRYQNIRRARKSGWGDDYPVFDGSSGWHLSGCSDRKGTPTLGGGITRRWGSR